MKTINKAKAFISYKIKSKKQEIKLKADSVKDQIVLNYLIPYLTNYVKEAIIAKGLNPNAQPAPKEDPNLIVSSYLSSKRLSTCFDHYVPKWLRASFKDPTKHPLFALKQKSESKPAAFVAVEPNKIADEILSTLFNSRSNNVLDSDTMPNVVSEVAPEKSKLETVVERFEARAEIIEKAKKKIKSKPIKKEDIEVTVMALPQEPKVTKLFKNSSFRRVAAK